MLSGVVFFADARHYRKVYIIVMSLRAIWLDLIAAWFTCSSVCAGGMLFVHCVFWVCGQGYVFHCLWM